ncbi:UDP-N-acetylmuramate--L-alanine ligase [Clostridium sp. DL1XJH146]
MTFDFLEDKHKKIHFIGIGGISMSGLAEILLDKGYSVSGSDRNNSVLIEKLKSLGAEIFIGHNSSNITKDVDLIVYTAAIPNDNPELIEGSKLNISIMDRAEFLGHIMRGHKYNVAVAGTHGKTTTTSMLSSIILQAKLDPTILVGGNLDLIDGNVKVGDSEYFITEACEYKASFLKFYPYLGIVLNIEEDHLDFYKDINEIQETFSKFADLIPDDGCYIYNAEDKRAYLIATKATCNTLGFGIEKGEIRAQNISYENGIPKFDVYKNDKYVITIKLQVPGRHNILNSLASIAAAFLLNVDNENIRLGLYNFAGTHRRFEIKGNVNGITVIDDYAHHPTEIKATLLATKKFPHNRIVCVFQPHTYTRTKTLFSDFADSFGDADSLILAEIYAAREKNDGSISSTMLGNKLRENGVDCKNFETFEEISTYLKTQLKDGDLLLTIGAGDIYRVGEMFLEN